MSDAGAHLFLAGLAIVLGGLCAYNIAIAVREARIAFEGITIIWPWTKQ
jgi:hypothetical protein